MTGLDLDAAAKEAEAVAERLREVAARIEELQRELRRLAEEQAGLVVKAFVPEPKQAEALALVHRGFRIADQVGAWFGVQGYLGLAQKLGPELEAGYAELQAFLRPASPDLGVTR